MAYVEWLRVRGALKIIAIVFGVLFVTAAIVRVAVIGLEHNVLDRVASMQSDPGAKVTRTTLPDGTQRLTIDDPLKKTYVVIDDRGWRGKHIEVLDRSGSTHHHESTMIGSIHVQSLPRNGGELTTIDTNGSTPFFNYLIPAIIAGLILATVLGAPFARENDGHLEISLTKPFPRELLALSIIGIDVAGLLAVLVLGVVFAIATSALFELPRITFDGFDAVGLGVAIFAPVAWYAMLTAATASIKRSYGAILGFAWPVAAIIVALSFIQPDGNALLALMHGIGWTLSFIDPVAYMHLSRHATVAVDGQNVLTYSGQYQILMLAVLAVLYSALAVVQWRRIEG
ncbi:MAG TPA: hypothetical protein VNF68_02085 [Candidatus Baltobacteraceae bacterium]|nr:hypothetical protein [Candidatus Baltobacteraceae bacterium]